MKLLITGAGGLLGRKLVSQALRAGHEVHSAYHTDPVNEGKPRRLELADEAGVNQIINEKSPDVVIHTASLTDVDLCEQNPELAMRVNGIATGFLAQACRRSRTFLVYVSTDYVFDGTRGHYKEEDQPNPINVYGRSKLHGEKEVVTQAADFCIARTSVIYGWGREHRPNFAVWLYGQLSERQSVSVVMDQYVSPTLNGQLARMLLEVAEKRLQGIYHLAGATRASRYEFAVHLARKLGFDERLLTPVKSESVGWKAKRPRDSSLDVRLALQTLINKPETLDDALGEFVKEAPAR